MKTIKFYNKCNQRCVFCQTQRSLDKGARKETPLLEIKKIIEQLELDSDKSILFTGGCEPTTLEDLPALIRLAKRKGCNEIGIETNGVKLEDEVYLRRLIEEGLSFCTISLHSHKTTISNFITQSNDYEKTIQSIKNLYKYNIRLFVQHTITSLNYKSLIPFIDYVKLLSPNIQCYLFSFIRPIFNDRNSESITPKISDVELEIKNMVEYCIKNKIKFRFTTGLSFPLCYLQDYLKYCDEIAVIAKGGLQKLKEISYPDEKIRGQACDYCSVSDICFGVYKSYARIHGTGELYPLFERPNIISSLSDQKNNLEYYINQFGFSKNTTINDIKKERGLILKTINRDGTLLDIGCNNALLLHLLQEWSEYKIEPYGIDIQDPKIKQAKNIFSSKQNNFARVDLWDLYSGVKTMQSIGFPEKFDFIYWNMWDDLNINKKNISAIKFLLKCINNHGRLILGFYNSAKENNSNLERVKKLSTRIKMCGCMFDDRKNIIVWLENNQA